MQAPVERADPDQVVRRLPDAVALTRALGDLRFQRLVEFAQREFGAEPVGLVARDLEETPVAAARVRRQVMNRAVHEHAAAVPAQVPAPVGGEALAGRCGEVCLGCSAVAVLGG